MKSGIEYFPFDVTLDDKFELIEAEFGLTGFAVVVKLLQRIYGGKGYYCEYTNEVALLFSKKLGLYDGGNVVSEIVQAAIRRGIFDKEMFKQYHILTSRGIQKRYFEAVNRRKQIEVKNKYLLIEVAQICKGVNILSENVNKKKENEYISKQSKVEESRGEKRKNISSPDKPSICGFAEFWKSYPKKVGKGAAEKAWGKICPNEGLQKAILLAVLRQKKSSQWQKDDGQYIPNPTTWLSQRRWEDEEIQPYMLNQSGSSYDLGEIEKLITYGGKK